jgi:hypothetical protein
MCGVLDHPQITRMNADYMMDDVRRPAAKRPGQAGSGRREREPQRSCGLVFTPSATRMSTAAPCRRTSAAQERTPHRRSGVFNPRHPRNPRMKTRSTVRPPSEGTPMNRSGFRWIAALTVFVVVATTATGAAPEHDRLKAMCGTWDVEMTFVLQPGRPGITTKGTSTIRPLFDGLFVEEKIEGTLNGRAFTTLAWTGFNATTRQYEATRIASTNGSRIAESGVYDEASKQFELKADYPLAGDTWHQRTVIQPLSGDTMIATSYLSFGAVPEWKSVVIKYTRKPA